MLLTKNNAALSLLFDLHLLGHGDTEVLFGSDFDGDRTDIQVCATVLRRKQYTPSILRSIVITRFEFPKKQ